MVAGKGRGGAPRSLLPTGVRQRRRAAASSALLDLSGRRLLERAAAEHARQVALVLLGGVEVRRRLRALGGLLGGGGDRARVQRPAAQRVLRGGRAQWHVAHVGEADAHVLAGAVARLLDERGDGHHRPVLLTAVELLVAEPVAVERGEADLRDDLVVADRRREVV